jgi:hypothetical protein
MEKKCFRILLQHGRSPEVSQDKPQVSIRGIFKQEIFGTNFGNHTGVYHATIQLRSSMSEIKEGS